MINAAVGGGFSSVSLGTLAHDGMRFQPDVVTSLNGINDILVLDERTRLIYDRRRAVQAFALSHDAIRNSQALRPTDWALLRPGILEQLAGNSALFQLAWQSSLVAAIRRHPASPYGHVVAPPPPSVTGYSTAHPEHLDAYINNQLAMSYLAEGSGGNSLVSCNHISRLNTSCG